MSELAFIAILDHGLSAIPALTKALQTQRLHTVYIDPLRCGSVHDYGRAWHKTLSHEPATKSGLTLSYADEEALRHLRGGYTFRAQTDPRITLQHSESLDGWTLICEEDPLWSQSVAPGQVYLKPLPIDWHHALLYTDTPLARAAVWPSSTNGEGTASVTTKVPVSEWVSLDPQ